MEEKELRRQIGRVQKILLAVYIVSLAICFLMTAVIVFAVGLSVDGTLEYVLEDMAKTSPQDVRMLLVIVVLYSLPYLFLCALFEIMKQQRSYILRRLPEEDRKLFGQMSRAEVSVMRKTSLFDERVLVERRKRGYTVEIGEVVPLRNYFLYRDKWTPLFWRMTAYEDVVWLYEGHSMFQYTDMEKFIVTPRFHFYTIVFYTRDGKKHRIITTQEGRYEYRNILDHCRDVIQGYGAEQKELAKQRLLMWEGMDSTIGQGRSERRAVYVRTAVLILLVSALGFFGYRQYTAYIESDAYLYRQCMKEAEREMAEGSGHYLSAYMQYEEARSYESSSEEAKEGSYQALLSLARENASLIDFYPGSYSGTCYEMLLSGYDAAPEIYLEAAQAYLDNGDYMEALSVLERGFQDAGYQELEAVYESVAEHLKVVSRVTYENGYAANRTEKSCDESGIVRLEETYVRSGEIAEKLLFDEAGNETDRIHYHKNGDISNRMKKSYDQAGNCICEEYYHDDDRFPESTTVYTYDGGRLTQTEMYGKDMILYRRENYTYDEKGNDTSYRVVEIDPETGEECETFLSETEYDASGNQLRYTEKRGDELVWENLYEYDDADRLIRDEIRSYDTGEYYHTEYVWQDTEDGGSLCESFDYVDMDGDLYSITKTRYDAAGRKTQVAVSNLKEGTAYEYAYSYDENDNVVWKKTPEQEIWYTYDERQNLTWMKTGYLSKNGGISERTYTYDELGNLTERLYTYTEKGEQTQDKTEYVYTYVYTGKALGGAE